MFGAKRGIRNGLTRFGPFVAMLLHFVLDGPDATAAGIDHDPDPLAIFVGDFEAGIAPSPGGSRQPPNWEKRSMRRAALKSMNSLATKFGDFARDFHVKICWVEMLDRANTGAPRGQSGPESVDTNPQRGDGTEARYYYPSHQPCPFVRRRWRLMGDLVRHEATMAYAHQLPGQSPTPVESRSIHPDPGS